jgi:pantoate--beta-alanine ligase
MGALHQGHRALVSQARAVADVVVVSIFVNPLQFGPAEDLDRYPRSPDADLVVCAEEGVDVVFVPGVEDMYPAGLPRVRVSAGPVGELLEGASRPGHFDGVLTVVLKLLDLVGPDLAMFGQKDAQQLALVRRMVLDLDVPTRIVPVPTVRSTDGLALSSRNRRLGADGTRAALALSRALRAGSARVGAGAVAVLGAAVDELASSPGLVPDYCVLVDPDTFAAVPADHVGPALLLLAARVGEGAAAVRLIDNASLDLPAVRSPGPDTAGPPS